jgi:hypothetical protein
MWMITLITLPSSVVNALTAFSLGRLVKYTGAIPIFIAGAYEYFYTENTVF